MRPEGWLEHKKPYNDDYLIGFEAGADAYEEGLLNSAESYHPNSGILKDKLKKHSFPKGRLVFIPDETE